MRRIASDGAVGRGDNCARGLFNGVDCGHRTGAVENLTHQCTQLSKTNAAGHTFAARLRVAQLQKGQRHIDGTQSRRTGRDPALHILVQPVNDSLRLTRGFDIESAQGYFTPSYFLHTIMLFLIYCIALLV